MQLREKYNPNPVTRLSRHQALSLWQTVTLGSVLDTGPDLTSRQFSILMIVYLEQGPHTVKSLAETLNVTKAVITRALDTLGRYKFVTRSPDPRDARSIIVQRTGPGSAFLTRFADRICHEFKSTFCK